MDVHTIEVWLGGVGLFGGCIAAVWGLSWAINNKIEEKVRERNEKISSVFRRLDEVKTDASDKYQSKDVCSVLHKTLGEKVDGIKVDVDEVKGDVKKLLGFANGNSKPKRRRRGG